ncbi:MAG: inner membrane protein [Puniceicoccaceae bacterium 5H]|nr:MAG: inner membrane protein [Puniceicoccaceae bacterium 5H]
MNSVSVDDRSLYPIIACYVMMFALLALIAGLILLVWSADRFVEGAADTAGHLGLPPLLIGMLVIGFGTSAPEMIVSVLAAASGTPDLALGNAYGSNITNIAFILAVTALISPLRVQSQVIRRELPILLLVTGFSLYQIFDGEISRLDAVGLLAVFGGLVGWSIWQGRQSSRDTMAAGDAPTEPKNPLPQAILWTVVGLVLLVGSSRLLVWGAVEIAELLGVSELIIGLTIVAIGTSLPELASSIAAARKNQHDLAVGNIVGSNLFNTLGVLGLAGVVSPIRVDGSVFWRDGLLMLGLTVALLIFGGLWSAGKVDRREGLVLVLIYASYIGWLVFTNLPTTPGSALPAR